MSQNPYNAARGAANAANTGDDLDALVDSLIGDDPAGRADVARQRAEEARRADVPRAPDRVTDELRAQIRSIALRVQALSEANASQAQRDREIGELRQAMREVLVATHRQSNPPTTVTTEVQVPSLQIKLVLAETAHLLHQADRDVATLGSWGMLFGGVGLGTLFALLFEVFKPYTPVFYIQLAVAIFALLVALVFAILTRQARRRAVNAHRILGEGTITRVLNGQ